MGTALAECLPPARLNRQLAALSRRLPRAAGLIGQAEIPMDAQLVTGRDGSPTLCWSEPGGQLTWLGRTTMPQVRAEALIDAFAAGSGNVLLVGMGQGAEIGLLLQRLAPHQAVFVIEGDCAAVGLALRLHDFGEAIDAGRVLIFPGDSAWDDLHRFLIEHSGYLSPDRVLSWPHFGHEQVHAISTRLSAICHDVASRRAARRTELTERLEAPAAAFNESSQATGPIAVIAGTAGPAVRNLAARLCTGARAVGWACNSFVYDRPDAVHPLAVEASLATVRPARIVLLDAVPAALAIRLPAAPLSILPSHGLPLTTEWVQHIPATARLIARGARQRQSAIDAGMPPGRVDFCPPAALPPIARSNHVVGRDSINESKAIAGRSVALLSTSVDPSAAAAGLILATHARLYERAAQVASRRIDSISAADADAILTAAEKELGLAIRNPAVRGGLVDRVRRILIPALIVAAYAEAACRQDAAIVRLGPDDAATLLHDVGLVIVLDAADRHVDAILDAMARNACVALRRADESIATALGDVLEIESHMLTFSSRKELCDLLIRFHLDAAHFESHGAVVGDHIRAAHTWQQRISAFMAGSACEPAVAADRRACE